MNTLYKLRAYIEANPDAKPEVTVAWWIAEDNKDKEPANVPDIAMCSSNCPRRNNCRRHIDCGLMVPGPNQTWILPKEFPCHAYWMAPHDFMKAKGRNYEKP
jgi:hypothetical protein